MPRERVEDSTALDVREFASARVRRVHLPASGRRFLVFGG